MDLIEKYLSESKMGKLPEKVERIAYLKDYPGMLEWKLFNPSSSDNTTNYKKIEGIAWKELNNMKQKKLLDFYDSDFNVNMFANVSGDNIHYEATVRLIQFRDKELQKALRQFKFKVIG